MSIFSEINNFYKKVVLAEDEPKELMAERFGETITPNMRALRLSMTVADYLVSMGVPASDVASVSLGITDQYCKRAVSVEIISTVLMFSQDRGNEREPLTLIRTTAPRTVNSSLIQAIEDIASDIHDGKLTLDEAEIRLERILEKPKNYPHWVLSMGGGAISAGIGALLSGSPFMIFLSFLVGTAISLMLFGLSNKRMPAFFIQTSAAAVTTLIAALVTWLGNNGVDFLQGLDPNLIIIGGIVMLVSGLAIVSAVEDAIDEYYITANARILQVVMMTSGIVAGIVIGLYIAKLLGVQMTINTNKALFHTVGWHYLGASLIAAGYALSVNTRFKGIVLAAVIGLAGWGVYAATLPALSPIGASFVAATAVGAGAGVVARWLRIPSITMTTAGIISLVPGLSLFNGLMLLVTGTTAGSDAMDDGGVILINALLLALAIAAGASFGSLIARPVRHTLVRARNALPRRKLRD